ncbi:MAG: hypothetical protein ACUVUC_10015 [Thermoguttaceae bacterium]
MQTAKQLSVSLVNKPGRLASMLAALNKGKVNFRALVVMDSGARGTVRFVPDDYRAATGVLDKLNIRYDATDVLLVEVPKRAGAFRKICERLAAEHLNIDYVYASFVEHGAKGGGLAVIKVNNLNKAQKVLSDNGGSNFRRQTPIHRPMHAR